MNTTKRRGRAKGGLGILFPIPRDIDKARRVFTKKFAENLERFRVSMQDASRAYAKTKHYGTSQEKLERELSEIENHGKKVESLIALLCQTWTGYLNDLVNADIKHEVAGEHSVNLILNLMRLSRHFVEPDKPTGIGSKSKRGSQFNDDILPFVRQVEKNIIKLVGLLEGQDWTPDLALQSAWRAEVEIRTVRLKLDSATLIGKNKSKTEEQAMKELTDQFDRQRAKEIIDALIFDLGRIGFDLNPTAHSWSDRVRHRRGKSLKKLRRRP